jgi:deazaflavin-dependent oxidoreductase (nitroreductase family)
MKDPFRIRLADFFGRRLANPGAHTRMYRLTNGRVGHGAPPGAVLLLTVTGRRSGQPRTTPVAYFDIGDKRVLAATNMGRDGLPEWFRNLRAEPRVMVQVRSDTTDATARIAEGDEREKLWSEIEANSPLYARFQRRSPQPIPVVVLEPRKG